MPLLQVEAIIKETNTGLILSGIESSSTDYIKVKMGIRTEEIERLFTLDEYVVLKLFSGEYLVVCGELEELLYEIDSLEYPEGYECEVELDEGEE